MRKFQIVFGVPGYPGMEKADGSKIEPGESTEAADLLAKYLSAILTKARKNTSLRTGEVENPEGPLPLYFDSKGWEMPYKGHTKAYAQIQEFCEALFQRPEILEQIREVDLVLIAQSRMNEIEEENSRKLN